MQSPQAVESLFRMANTRFHLSEDGQDLLEYGLLAALIAFLGTAVAGGVFAVAVAARRGRLIATIEGTGQLVTAPSAAKMEIEAPARANRFAYAPAIAVGSLVAVLLTAKW